MPKNGFSLHLGRLLIDLLNSDAIQLDSSLDRKHRPTANKNTGTQNSYSLFYKNIRTV